MIWNHYGPSHWVCKDFAHEDENGMSHGYVIHARCRPKRNMKTIFDKIPESWVEQLSLDGKKVAHFKNEPHIMTAMSKAVSYVKGCLELQQKVQEKLHPEVPKEEIDKLKEEFNKSIDSAETWRTPIYNSTESNN